MRSILRPRCMLPSAAADTARRFQVYRCVDPACKAKQLLQSVVGCGQELQEQHLSHRTCVGVPPADILLAVARVAGLALLHHGQNIKRSLLRGHIGSTKQRQSNVTPCHSAACASSRADPGLMVLAHREPPTDQLDTQTTRHSCWMLLLLLPTLYRQRGAGHAFVLPQMFVSTACVVRRSQ